MTSRPTTAIFVALELIVLVIVGEVHAGESGTNCHIWQTRHEILFKGLGARTPGPELVKYIEKQIGPRPNGCDVR